ncbi:MAG: HAD family hydrolase [Armatimonadota bacterium]
MISIRTPSGEARILARSADRIAEIDSLIFDVDGVLIDVRDSIRLVHGATARMYFEGLGWTNCDALVSPGDVDAFKLAGGFNSDWELAYAWTLLYLWKSAHYGSTDGAELATASPTLVEFAGECAGGLSGAVALIRNMPGDWGALLSSWDRGTVRELFIENYGGDLCPELYGVQPKRVKGPGYIHRDRALLDPTLIPPNLALGLATGRTGGETAVGMRLMGWESLFSVAVTEDDQVWKPDPAVLALAVERLGAKKPLYVGDTPDDLLTAVRYNERDGDMLVCMVETGFGSSADRFAGADMIAENVNAALAAVREVRYAPKS